MADYHLQALTLAKAGNWDDSHNIIQKHSDAMSCRIHAWLHRVEGDLSNARYWYNRADVEEATGSVEDELDELLKLVE